MELFRVGHGGRHGEEQVRVLSWRGCQQDSIRHDKREASKVQFKYTFQKEHIIDIQGGLSGRGQVFVDIEIRVAL